MITLFRRLRQRLLSENKFSKYLIYAIGEIILVVIGILIALQINNWNENRKLQQKEVQILKEIRSDLFQTKKDIFRTVEYHKKLVSQTQFLLNAIYNKVSYSDSIYRAFADSGYDSKIIPKSSSFENLKTIGLNAISNDSLRTAITTIFQLSFSRLTNDFQEDNSEFDISNMLYPYQQKYFEIDFSNFVMQPRKHSDSLKLFKLKIANYHQFLNDTELFKIIQLSMYTRSNLIDSQIEVIDDIDTVVEQIENELEKKAR
ncbi:DUF6090 family protein [Psychroserpens luteus]|uniref:DUF6090 family protein n=1 Tax=Psychroserpens luteus TaxID=1434066 RepID=A0ABW5ZY32_9FLAO|nr:DUF6090 family protein [Psychroserpens luteus]